MKDRDVVNELIQVGFTKELADLYLFIIKHSPFNLMTLFKEIKIPKNVEEKRKLLEELALRKLIIVDRDNIFAMNPRIAFKALGQERVWQDIVSLDICGISKSKKQILEDFQQKCIIIGNELYKFYNYRSPIGFNNIKLAKDSEEMSSLLADAIAKATREILSVSKSPRLPQISIIWSSILEKLNQNVIYKRIADFKEIEEHGLSIVTRDVKEIGVNLCILENRSITHKFYLIDKSIIIIFSPLESIGKFKLEGQVVGNKLIAKRYREIFDELYSKATPAQYILPVMFDITNKVLKDVSGNLGEREAEWLNHLIEYGCFAKFPTFSVAEGEGIRNKLLQLGYIEIRDLPFGNVPIFPYNLDLLEVIKYKE